MGQEILYCAKCAKRLTTADFEKGLGIRVGVKVACTDCLPELVSSLTPQEQRDFAKEIAKRKAPKAEVKSESKRNSSGQIPVIKRAGSPAQGNAGAVMVLVGIAIAAVIGTVVILAGGSEKRPPDPAPPTIRKPDPIKIPEEDPPIRAAREAMDRARKIPSGNLDAQIAAWAQAASVAQGTPFQKEASAMHQSLLDLRKAAQDKEASELDAQAAPLLNREEFVAANDLFERARRRHEGPEWSSLIDARIRGLRTRVDTLFAPLLQKAVDAQRRAAEDEIKAIRERIARWQRPDLSADLDRALAAAPPVVPGERPWKPIFDGKSLDFITKQSRKGWEIEDGTLLMKIPNAVHTREDFGDGEFRFRFEAREIDGLYVGVKKTSEAYCRVLWEKGAFKSLEGKPCEVVFICRGESVTAQVNGQPAEVQTAGRPALGSLMFNAKGKYFRLLSLEYRNLP